MFPQKSPFCPLIGAFYPHFASQSALRAAGGQPLSGTRGKRVATFALVTTVGPQPRPARSTPGELGRAANRQAFASLSHPANRQVVRNPHVGRTGFLVSMTIHPRTAVRRGRHAGLVLIPNAKDGRYDPDIHSLRQSGRGYSLNEPTFPGPPTFWHLKGVGSPKLPAPWFPGIRPGGRGWCRGN